MPLTYEIWYAPKDPSDTADVFIEGSSLNLDLVYDHKCKYNGYAVSFVKITYSKDAWDNFPASNFTITASPSSHTMVPIKGYQWSGSPTGIGDIAYSQPNGNDWLLTVTPPGYDAPETSATTLWLFGTTTPPPKLKVIVKRQDLTYAP